MIHLQEKEESVNSRFFFYLLNLLTFGAKEPSLLRHYGWQQQGARCGNAGRVQPQGAQRW